MADNLMTITLDDKEMVAEILFTHFDDQNDKEYVVFKFVDSDEISAARYIQTDEQGGYFEDIETEEEWDMLDDLLQEYLDSEEAEDDQEEE